MRVLHVIPTLGGGGAERQVAYLAEGMCARRVDVHVATLRGGPHALRIASAGATIHYMTGDGNYHPRRVARMIRLVRAIQPDVIQTWLRQSDVVGGIAALTQRVPWILSERSSPEGYSRSWKDRLRYLLGRHADAIVANSPSGITYWDSSSARKFLVPNAVDLQAIDAIAPAVIEADASQKVVLYAGRLEAEKNLEMLVPALCEVARSRNAIVVVCGEGSKEPEMRAHIERLGCSDRFRMFGFTDAVWPLMKRADAFVSASWFEGQPNAVVEAAIARCPLVLSDIPAHRAVLDDGCATFAPRSDASAIARALEGVLDHPDTARQKAERARAAVEGWSIEYSTSEYIKIYEGLLS